MIVAGGVYYERCLTPNVVNLFGSGGRAAVALSGFSKVTLHTFFPMSEEGDVSANMGAFGVETVVHAPIRVRNPSDLTSPILSTTLIDGRRILSGTFETSFQVMDESLEQFTVELVPENASSGTVLLTSDSSGIKQIAIDSGRFENGFYTLKAHAIDPVA